MFCTKLLENVLCHIVHKKVKQKNKLFLCIKVLFVLQKASIRVYSLLKVTTKKRKCRLAL